MIEAPERTLYVIGVEDSGPVKIGVTNDALKRLAQLQTGHDRLLKIFYTASCKATHILSLESLIHQQLSEKRLVGEWFSVDVETAIFEMNYAIIRWESDDTLDRKIRNKERQRSYKRDGKVRT